MLEALKCYQAAYDMMSDVDYRCTITLRYAALRVYVEESKFHPLEERPLVVRERQTERWKKARGGAKIAPPRAFWA